MLQYFASIVVPIVFMLSAADNGVGPKDFSFSEISRARREREELERKAIPSPAPENPSSPKDGRSSLEQMPGQMPGQAPTSTVEHPGFNVRSTDEVPSDSGWIYKYGPPSGQYSNVPGTTPVSPNGTANAFGTGGRPIRLGEEPLEALE